MLVGVQSEFLVTKRSYKPFKFSEWKIRKQKQKETSKRVLTCIDSKIPALENYEHIYYYAERFLG